MPKPTFPTLLALALAFCTTFLQAAKPPNILYILCDDLGFSDLGCFGERDQNPEPRQPRRRWAPPDPILQHRPLLPFPGQPSSQASIPTGSALAT